MTLISQLINNHNPVLGYLVIDLAPSSSLSVVLNLSFSGSLWSHCLYLHLPYPGYIFCWIWYHTCYFIFIFIFLLYFFSTTFVSACTSNSNYISFWIVLVLVLLQKYCHIYHPCHQLDYIQVLHLLMSTLV